MTCGEFKKIIKDSYPDDEICFITDATFTITQEERDKLNLIGYEEYSYEDENGDINRDYYMITNKKGSD